MSRDLTPKELDQLQKVYDMPNIVETMKVSINDGPEQDAYDEEQKAMVRTYPRLGMFGFDFLNLCRHNGVLADDKGCQLIQEIENYFASGESMTDQTLQDKVAAWYEGRLSGGYYMTQNNEELAYILRQYVKNSQDI